MAQVSQAESAIKSIFLILFIIFAVIGNIFVCVAIRKNKRLKTMTNYYVFNLAIADLLYGLTGMPLLLITAIAREWILGDVLCQISGTLTTLFVLVSIWTMCLIGVNRYFAVGHSTSYKSIYKKKRVLLSIGCIWLVAAIISVAPQFGWSSIHQGVSFCTIDGKDDISYSIFVILFAYVAPLIALICLYTKIFLILRKHEKTMAGMRSGSRRAPSEFEPDSMDFSSTFKAESAKANSLPRDVNLGRSLSRTEKADSFNAGENAAANNGSITQHGGEVNSNVDSFSGSFPVASSEAAATDQPCVTEGILDNSENFGTPGHTAENNSYLSVSKQAENLNEENSQSRPTSGSGVHLMMDERSEKPSSVSYHVSVEDEENIRQPRKTRTLSGIANVLKLTRSRTSKKIKKFKMEANITKMLFVVVAVFFLCWTPLVIGTILYAFNAEPKNFNLLSMGFVIASMNSICNPIIYAFMNQLFRKAFKDLFTVCRLRNDQQSETS